MKPLVELIREHSPDTVSLRLGEDKMTSSWGFSYHAPLSNAQSAQDYEFTINSLTFELQKILESAKLNINRQEHHALRYPPANVEDKYVPKNALDRLAWDLFGLKRAPHQEDYAMQKLMVFEYDDGRKVVLSVSPQRCIRRLSEEGKLDYSENISRVVSGVQLIIHLEGFSNDDQIYIKISELIERGNFKPFARAFPN